jgi:predicted O-methyltransferase YrrM
MKKEHPWEIEPQVYPLIYGLVRAIKPSQVVETGTFTGKSTISIAKALRDNKRGFLWSIDIKDFEAGKRLEEEKLTKFVKLIIGQSPQALEKVMSKNEIDFVFLDNGHLYPTVSAELEIAHKYLIPEGYVMGHDYRPEHKGVFPAVNDFLARHKGEYEKVTITSENGFFIIRKL